jgi:pimeloyl-ACP methyl ester carboxylesterase
MKDLILLHGALGSKEQLQKLEDNLTPAYNVHRLNLPGHGGEKLEPFEFSIPGFADALTGYVKNNNLSNPSIFGYSMGGFVALYAAAHKLFPIDKIVTLATKLDWSPMIAAKETAMLDPVALENKVPAFVQVLAQRHSPQPWQEHLKLTAGLMKHLGEVNLLNSTLASTIQQPVLLLLGDSDKMVSPQETIIFKEQLPNAAFKVLQDTPHPIEKTDPISLAQMIHIFLEEH